MMDKYCYSINDGEYYYGCYDSREDAIENGKDDLTAEIDDIDLAENKTFEILTAKCDFYEPKITKYDVENIIESISDCAFNYCGVDDCMDDLSREDIKSLEETLNEAFQKWLKENYKRRFWGVDDVQEHILTHDDLGVKNQ
ncbi:MAG: hypothetical protein MJ170_02870 [Alphaproteobacteria bacterium]|nr:hypothetical protein [Alphaproteobacteria bacterium]